jgi:small subunit ribosomal protein S20
MPNLRSSKKAMRRSRTAAERNRAQRAALRTALKKADGGTAEQKRGAVQLLDRAARKGLIHPNKAARHKSTLAKQGAK